MTKADLMEFLDFGRKKTLDLLDAIAKLPNPSAALAFRAGPGRAHLGWQLMHIGATDDRHVHARMRGGEPQQPELVRRFAGGSTPDEQIPTLDDIRSYLAAQREELKSQYAQLKESDLANKPNAQAPWTYHEWIKVLVWHEAHHQGQAHLTLNLYKAANP